MADITNNRALLQGSEGNPIIISDQMGSLAAAAVDVCRKREQSLDIFAEYERVYGPCSAVKSTSAPSKRTLPRSDSVSDASLVVADGSLENEFCEEQFPVNFLIEKWGDYFLLEWEDPPRTRSWVHRDDIADDLVGPFEQSWDGYHKGVKVLRRCRRHGKRHARLHFNHWPGRHASCWVLEKSLNPAIRNHYMKKCNVRRRRRT